MKQFFKNPIARYGAIALGIIALYFGGKALYDAGAKSELERRLARVNDALRALRSSDSNYINLVAAKKVIEDKLNAYK